MEGDQQSKLFNNSHCLHPKRNVLQTEQFCTIRMISLKCLWYDVKDNTEKSSKQNWGNNKGIVYYLEEPDKLWMQSIDTFSREWLNKKKARFVCYIDYEKSLLQSIME